MMTSIRRQSAAVVGVVLAEIVVGMAIFNNVQSFRTLPPSVATFPRSILEIWEW